MTNTHLSLFQQHRAHCFGLAYRMLGSKTEAEDILQETYERWHGQSLNSIENAQAFLTTIVSRLCIDQLRKHQQRRHYIGNWLPEPLYDNELSQAGPFETQSTYQSLSLAFLLLLEQLNPSERAVFLLRETFDYSYQEISDIINKAPDNCRQLCRRAKLRLKENTEYQTINNTNNIQQQQLLSSFLACFGQQDLAQFQQLLTDDISLISDGGGKVQSVLRPLYGKDRIIRFFKAIKKRGITQHLNINIVLVNGKTSVLITSNNNERSLFTLECDHNKIQRILIIRNPDKLPRNFDQPNN